MGRHAYRQTDRQIYIYVLKEGELENTWEKRQERKSISTLNQTDKDNDSV